MYLVLNTLTGRLSFTSFISEVYMKNNDIPSVEYWIHPDGFIYIGDQIVGARAATDEEIATLIADNKNLEDLAGY